MNTTIEIHDSTVAEIAEMSELDKKSVNRVFESLTEIIKKQLGSRGPGEFVIPGLLKLRAIQITGHADPLVL